MWTSFKLLLIFALFAPFSAENLNACESRIYCKGDLLHEVQMANVFPDSKTFVDMTMLKDEEEILKDFEVLMSNTNRSPSQEQIKDFIAKNFIENKELVEWQPEDFNPNPKFLAEISDKKIQQFAQEIVSIWPKLSRKIIDEVRNDSSRSSIVPLPNGFIIPGGRFRESYYWDNYWIIKGLLISEMYDTVKGKLENFIFLIKKFGYIPNGGRVYYMKRSQPPLFVTMVRAYYDALKIKPEEWLRSNIQYLEDEMNYWLQSSSVNIKLGKRTYNLLRYFQRNPSPRPESYKEDYNVALTVTKDKRADLFSNLRGGAESGWDFSSRWIVNKTGGWYGNLSEIQTSRIIPVDLNSYIYRAFNDLSYLYSELNDDKAKTWKLQAEVMKEAIQAVFWNATENIWYDYDKALGKHRRYFVASNLAPLWSGAFDRNDESLPKKILSYLNSNDIFKFAGGIPTSLEYTGEQWDLPNAWPPLQDIVVEGLTNLGTQESRVRAKELALKWVDANIVGFDKTGAMFEKYDATEAGKYGGGGEYEVQSGFGWSNGVVLKFIYDFCRKRA